MSFCVTVPIQAGLCRRQIRETMCITSASRVLSTGCVLVLTSLGPVTAASAADLIIHGGKILTMAGEEPTYVDAVVVDSGKIIFVGTDADAMKLKTEATVIKELDGKTLLPGFIDAHS